MLNYGVTTSIITNAKTSAENFKMVTDSPRQAKVEREIKTKYIDTMLDKANNICKNSCDKMAMLFQETNPDFYYGYERTRKLVNLPTITTKFRSKITDIMTGTVLPLCEVIVNGTTLSATSDINGNIVIDKLPVGINTFTCMAQGYQTITTPDIDCKKGKYVRFNFKLIPEVEFKKQLLPSVN